MQALSSRTPQLCYITQARQSLPMRSDGSPWPQSCYPQPSARRFASYKLALVPCCLQPGTCLAMPDPAGIPLAAGGIIPCMFSGCSASLVLQRCLAC